MPASKANTTPIITGRLKGRKLVLPASEAVRPTRLRLRQAAFNMLASRLEFGGLRVADIGAGSGAWGLEALSRGAAHVWLIDTDTHAAATNVKALGLAADDVTLVKADAAHWAPPTPCDVVLADPPYANTALVPQVLAQAARWGTVGSWWLIETAAATGVTWPASFTNTKTTVSGVTALHIACYQGV